MLPLAALASACFPDDWDGQPYSGWDGLAGATDTAAPRSPLVGAWVSEGSDIAALLADPPFSYVRVDAVFGSDGSYSVDSITRDDLVIELSGTWSSDGSTTPAAIALHQTEPYEALASGIWQVEGGELTYEVVQTTPDYGYVPPTPAGGFGSTAGPGVEPGVNVQTFREAR
ncbi:MAG: hypothetical protein ABMA64_18015 [Myxococcota bacterium]